MRGGAGDAGMPHFASATTRGGENSWQRENGWAGQLCSGQDMQLLHSSAVVDHAPSTQPTWCTAAESAASMVMLPFANAACCCWPGARLTTAIASADSLLLACCSRLPERPATGHAGRSVT